MLFSLDGGNYKNDIKFYETSICDNGVLSLPRRTYIVDIYLHDIDTYI